ncbi:MAG: OB-fold protein [Pseudomonadota bacterium]
MRERLLLLVLPATLLLSGCKALDALDGALDTFDDGLHATGDALSGDLRPLAGATRITLPQLWAEWKKNAINAQDKYQRTRLTVPGIVTGLSKTTANAMAPAQFVVYFRDPSDGRCTGVATTRDDLLVQKKRVSALAAGDRIEFTGVLDDHTGSVMTATRCVFSFSKVQFATPAKKS